MAGLVGGRMELVTRLPGGDLIVFGLAIAISCDGVPGPPLGDPAAAAARGARERPDLRRVRVGERVRSPTLRRFLP